MKQKNTLYNEFRFLLIGLVLLMLVPSAFAQSEWRYLTDFTQSSVAVWMSSGFGNKTYVISNDNKVYYTTDSEQWLPFANNPSSANFGSIKASTTSHRVFCLTFGALHFTDNLGVSWQTRVISNNGSQTGNGAMILGYGVYENQVAVAVIGPITSEIQNRLFYSSNQGNSFSEIGIIPFYPTAFHFTSDGSIYANTGSGIFKTNSITNPIWESIGFDGNEVTDLEVYEDTLIASVKFSTGQGSVYKSTDAGNTWTELEGLPICVISKLAMDWTSNKLVATTTAGVYLYNTTAWELVHSSRHAHEVVSSLSGEFWFSGVRMDKIYRMGDNATLPEPRIQGLELQPDLMQISADQKIYTAAQISAYVESFDLETSHASTHDLFSQYPVTRILSMTATLEGECVVGGLHYIAKYNALTDTFEEIANEETAPLAPVYNQLVPQRLFVGNDNSSIAMIQHSSQNYIDYSPDMGSSWQQVLPTLNGTTSAYFSIDKVLINTASIFVLGASSANFQNLLLKNQLGASNWQTIPLGSLGINSIYLDRTDILYGVSHTNVYKWEDVQSQWVALPLHLGNFSNKVTELVFNENNELYILNRSTLEDSPEEGLFIYDAISETFHFAPFPTLNGQKMKMKNLVLSAQSIPIAMTYVSGSTSYEKGIYYYHYEPTFSVEESLSNSVVLYPNPTSNYIDIQGLEQQDYMVKLSNMLGQNVEVNNQNHRISMQDLAAGVYSLRIIMGNKIISKKVVKNI
jgi:hypothetical protein